MTLLGPILKAHNPEDTFPRRHHDAPYVSLDAPEGRRFVYLLAGGRILGSCVTTKRSRGGRGEAKKRTRRKALSRFIADFVAAQSEPHQCHQDVIPREAPAGSPRVQDLQRRPRNLLAHARAPPIFTDSPVQAVSPGAPLAREESRGRVPARRGPPGRPGRFLGRRTDIQHTSASRGASLGMTTRAMAATKSTKNLFLRVLSLWLRVLRVIQRRDPDAHGPFPIQWTPERHSARGGNGRSGILHLRILRFLRSLYES